MAAAAQTPRLRENARPSLESASMLVNLLIVAIFLADLFTPFLIWKGVLPSVTRWLSDFATLAVVITLFLRMLVFDRFPVAIWLIAALSTLGIAQATFQGQGLAHDNLGLVEDISISFARHLCLSQSPLAQTISPEITPVVCGHFALSSDSPTRTICHR